VRPLDELHFWGASSPVDDAAFGATGRPSAESGHVQQDVTDNLDIAYGYALWLVIDASVAESIVIEASRRAMQERPPWIHSEFRLLFLRTVRRFAFDRLRQTTAPGAIGSAARLNRQTSPCSAASSGVYYSLKEAILGLPPLLRETIILRDVYEFKYREIADILEAPQHVMASRLELARRRLLENGSFDQT
jgi:DNA-directed RNA polymerase specialized sigma24 family protein